MTTENNTPEKKESKTEKSFFEIWADSFSKISKIWIDSHSKLCSSWIDAMENTFVKAAEMPKGEVKSEDYKELYNIWMKTNEKIYNDSLEMPAFKPVKETVKQLAEMSELYSKNFKICMDTYQDLYRPMFEDMKNLAERTSEIARNTMAPEVYKEEYYDQWMNPYKDTFDMMLATTPTKEIVEKYSENFNIYLKLYDTWVATIEDMSKKTENMIKTITKPEKYSEFLGMWSGMYEKSIDDFFTLVPIFDPMKDAIKPVKKTLRTYADTIIAQPTVIWSMFWEDKNAA